MKLIVAGSRTFNDYKLLEKSIFDFLSELQDKSSEIEIVSGEARGTDRLGELFALKHSLKCTHFPANWDAFGKSAGYKRNEQMAEYADACIVFWDGTSKGTQHMISIATEHVLHLKIIHFVQ
jgi:YspA, cpYpsA-related SLOG family